MIKTTLKLKTIPDYKSLPIAFSASWSICTKKEKYLYTELLLLTLLKDEGENKGADS